MLELFPAVWNGTLREHYLLLFSVAGSIALVFGFVGAWMGARLTSRRMIRELRETLPSNEQQVMANTQLNDLFTAVDAMALEVERLAEGQRFTTKVLREGGVPRHEPPRAPGVVTPH